MSFFSKMNSLKYLVSKVVFMNAWIVSSFSVLMYIRFVLAKNLVVVQTILVIKVIVISVDSAIIIPHLMLKELSMNRLN